MGMGIYRHDAKYAKEVMSGRFFRDRGRLATVSPSKRCCRWASALPMEGEPVVSRFCFGSEDEEHTSRRTITGDDYGERLRQLPA